MSKAYYSVGSRILSSSSSITREIEYDVNDVRELSYTIPPATTDQLVSLNLPYANLKTIAMEAQWDSSVATPSNVTVKTNSSGAPTQTFTVKPNKPDGWHADSWQTNPITANITALYLTNPHATASCTLKILVGNNL